MHVEHVLITMFFTGRFYADDSSLVHGSLSRNGENDTVYGQTEIQQRIISLNFRDCRAKIQQVDSLETLERGVVVQVSFPDSASACPVLIHVSDCRCPVSFQTAACRCADSSRPLYWLPDHPQTITSGMRYSAIRTTFSRMRRTVLT